MQQTRVTCVLLISVIVALFNTGCSRVTRDTAAISAANLGHLNFALRMYVQDNHGFLPPMNSSAAFKDAIAPYLGRDYYFFQPGTKTHCVLNPKLSHKNIMVFAKKSSVVTVYDPNVYSVGVRCVAFLDGSHKFVTKQEWSRLEKQNDL